MEIPVRNERLYTLSFTDNQVVAAQDEEDLSFMLRKLKVEHSKEGLETKFKKIEHLIAAEIRVEHLGIEENQQINSINT